MLVFNLRKSAPLFFYWNQRKEPKSYEYVRQHFAGVAFGGLFNWIAAGTYKREKEDGLDLRWSPADVGNRVLDLADMVLCSLALKVFKY